MKKDHVEEYDYLYTSYPLFSWKQCSKCKKDFRREKIWRALIGMGAERFLCMTCAPTEKEASKFFINKEFLPYRPDPPPPPPKRRWKRRDNIMNIDELKKEKKVVPKKRTKKKAEKTKTEESSHPRAFDSEPGRLRGYSESWWMW